MALLRAVALFFVVPLLVAWGGAEFGIARASQHPGSFFGAPALADAATLEALRTDGRMAVANGVWALGAAESVRRMTQGEGSRLPPSQGRARARLLLRFGLVDRSGEGRSALFSQACQADAATCDDLALSVRREAEARLVAPGNVVPARFASGPPARSATSP
jgi:hypothetical protein